MDQQATSSLSSKAPGDNGRSLVTPKRCKKNPGDILGSGKSQLPITRYYSPISSSSDRSSQPYSPIACSSRIKRRTSVDSPLPNKRLRTKTASHSQKQPIVISSSDDSSEEVFTNSKPPSAAVVTKPRLSHIKRRLYPAAYSPVSSGHSSSRPKKKLLPRRRFRVLSDSDSEGAVPAVPKQRSRVLTDSELEGVVPMENFQTDTKPLLDVVVLQSSQATQVRRYLYPETSSQAVVISSSEDSDFELHNSKPSQSFLSQSVCGPLPSQKSYLSSQTNRVGFTNTVGSPFIGKPPTGIENLPKKRCCRGVSSDSAYLALNDNFESETSAASAFDVNISSGRRQKALFERSPVSPDSSGGGGLVCDDMVESEYVHDEPKDESETLIPLTPVHNGDVPSIYLQDTIPLPDGASIKPDIDEANRPDIHKARHSSSKKRDFSKNADRKGTTDFPSHHASRSPLSDDSIYNEKTIDPGMNPDAALDSQATVDFKVKPLPNVIKANASGNDPGVDPEATLDWDATVDFSLKPLPNGIEATALGKDAGVDPEATLDWETTVDFSHESLTYGTPNATALASGFEATLPGCIQKGAVIEPSDDEDESIMEQNQSDQVQVSKNGGTSLGVIPMSELLDVSHISGSDNSDFSDIVHSDDDLMIDEIDLIPGSPGALATHVSSLLLEDSDASGAGITSVMNSMLDASADFFSDVVASFEAGEALEELGQFEDGKEAGNEDFCQDLSPTEGIVNIALKVTGLGRASDSFNAPSPVSSDCSDARRNALPDKGCVFKAEEASLIHNEEHVTPTPLKSPRTLPGDLENLVIDDLANLVTDSCMDLKVTPGNARPSIPSTEERTDLTSKSDCGDSRRSTEPEETDMSKAEEASLINNGENTTPLQSPRTLPGNLANLVTDSCMNVKVTPGNARSSMPNTEEPTDLSSTKSDCGDSRGITMPEEACGSKAGEASLVHDGENASPMPLMDITSTTNGLPAEMKIVCGSQGSFEDTAKIHITQNIDKTLIQNSNKLLLDAIIPECQNYAEHVLNQEPIKSFVFQYSNLPQPAKVALHGCLLELLENSNHWLKYQVPFASGINTLVSSGIFEYLKNNDDFVTKINHLEFSEITDVLCKLGNSPSKPIETMRNIILDKFSSAYTCERVKKEVIDLINRKFVKLTESALFCLKIVLDLFVLPLNLCDKLYKAVEIARFASTLIRNVNKRFLLLPLKTSRMIMNADRVLRDLSCLSRLKSGVFDSALNDESIYLRVNDICSSIAVLDVSAESDPSVKNSPTFRFLMTNYVHALDEQLKTLLYYNTSNIECGACVYLGVLLQQNVTGFQHKVKWCRERMRYLEKLFDADNFFEEFFKVLKEPAFPVQFMARSEFVSNALKIKKYGLSLDEKSHLMKLLRPISHKRTPLACLPLNSYPHCYTVLTKKTKGKNFNMIRANIFEIYKSDFPCGIEDNGSLLLNTIFLTFWKVIYQNIEGVFLNKFQNKPLDWGSEEFFLKRKTSIQKLVLEFEKYGLPALFKLINAIYEQFSSHHSVIDWQLVAPNMSKISSIVETLGLDKFLKISLYVLEKLDERILGFPDIVLWNPETKIMKFLALRKPADLYPYQVLWLEKLSDFELDAEELLMSGYTGPEQCSQLL